MESTVLFILPSFLKRKTKKKDVSTSNEKDIIKNKKRKKGKHGAQRALQKKNSNTIIR